MTSAEEAFKEDYDAVIGFLLENEPTLATRAGSVLTKALVLAGASELEVDFQHHVVDYYAEILGPASHAAHFVENKAVRRQFHTYFNWDAKNANQFFGLFGPDFLRALRERVASDDDFSASVQDFLELGRLRNEIVHQNFAAYALTRTADEVHALCGSARGLVDALPALLRSTYASPNN